MNKHKELRDRVKRFFEILDIKEESDQGNMFSPVFISCCRTMLQIELAKLLKEMKELSDD